MHDSKQQSQPGAQTQGLLSLLAEQPMKRTEPATTPCGSCPVVHDDPKSEAVSPLNAMPPPNQQPAAGQRLPLSTDRVESTIPGPQVGADVAEGGKRWLYPSPQMFYNAMRRKGYEPKEEEMRTVVAIHNTVNERTWHEVLEWESMHPECLEGLKLVRFGGKPDEPSMKARMYGVLGYKPPFDRHDWVVNRCGKEVRYLIDFYHGRPTPLKPVAMYIDARPAADDLSGVVDRLRMPFVRLWRAAGGRA